MIPQKLDTDVPTVTVHLGQALESVCAKSQLSFLAG